MTSDNKNHRRTQCHILFMAILIAVFAVTTVVSSCGNKGNLSQSEQEKYNNYRIAIQAAQDSGNYQKALQLSKEFYDESLKSHSPLFRANATSSYAQLLMVMGGSEEGKKILDELMQAPDEFINDTVMAEIYNAYGSYEISAGNNVYAAVEYYLKALGYARKNKDKQVLFGVLSDLDNAMMEAGDTTGIKYALESYQIAREMDDSLYQSIACIGLMGHFLKRDNYPEARKWIEKYLQLAPPSEAITSDMMKVKLYIGEKDYAKANHYMDLVLKAADSTEDMQTAQRSTIYYMKAALLARQHQYEESNKWLDKLMDYERQTNDKGNEKDAIDLYADNLEHLGNHQKALEYRKKYIKAVEENANTDRINILKAKEVALDVAKKDAEIEYQRDHAHLMEWLFGGAVAFCLLLAGLSLYIFNIYRRQRKLMTVVVERALPETVTIEQKQVDDRHVEIFRQIKEVIDDNKMFLDVNLSRDSLAKHLGTNRTYISEAVAKMTGMNFPQYINLLRVKEAERRLHDPQVDVSNFANFGRTLGFASLNAFRTAFKQQTGMTLSAYREIARRRPTPALPV